MYAGRVVEQGTLDEIFYDPQHPYTWGLLGSLTRLDRPRPQRLPQIAGAPPSLLDLPEGCAVPAPLPARVRQMRASCPALEARLAEAPGHRDRCWLDPGAEAREAPGRGADRAGGTAHERRRARCSRSPTWSSTSRSSAGILIDREVDQVRAVDGISFSVARGETLGLVGESGSGKSTACRAVLQLIEPTSGSVRFEGREIAGLSRRQMRPLRREMQMIFQDPYASLNPRKRVGQIVGDPLRLQGVASGAELRRRVAGAARAGRPLPRALQPLPARVLRRPAAADRDRPGAGAAAEAGDRRRAGLRARRLDPGADRQPARRPPGRVRPHLRLRRPRHRRRPPHLRPDRGHARRQDRRAGDRRPGLRAPDATPTRRSCSRRCRSRTRARAGARRERERARPGDAAALAADQAAAGADPQTAAGRRGVGVRAEARRLPGDRLRRRRGRLHPVARRQRPRPATSPS